MHQLDALEYFHKYMLYGYYVWKNGLNYMIKLMLYWKDLLKMKRVEQKIKHLILVSYLIFFMFLKNLHLMI